MKIQNTNLERPETPIHIQQRFLSQNLPFLKWQVATFTIKREKKIGTAVGSYSLRWPGIVFGHKKDLENTQPPQLPPRLRPCCFSAAFLLTPIVRALDTFSASLSTSSSL